MDQALNRLRLAPEDRDVLADTMQSLVRGVGVLQRKLSGHDNPPPDLAEPHLRAKRFARVRVAEMALFQAAQVKAGRTAHDLYGCLKPSIDEARQDFRREFLKVGLVETGQVPDYLHQELVLALAHNDASLLGPAYPGPLV
jgi:hypothetical protein